MDLVYEPIDQAIGRIIQHCKTEHGMYSLNNYGTEEEEYSRDKAERYAAMIHVLTAAQRYGQELFARSTPTADAEGTGQ